MRVFLLALAAVLLVSSGAQARTETIAAVVNQDAITMSDLADRLKLVMVSSGLADSPDIRRKLMPQILGSLVEERLKIQEARRLDIAVAPQEIADGFAELAQQNTMKPEKFRAMIEGGGINIATIERQIEAQIAWGKVIQQEMRPQVSVTDADIDDHMARLVRSKGRTEYLASDIFLPADSEEQRSKAQQLAARLAQEIASGKAPFFKVAQQFSAAPGAPQGGDLGWVQEGQLQPEIEGALKNLDKGKTSAPVRTADGYHILLLRDARAAGGAGLPPRDKVYTMIGVQRLERLQARRLLDLKATAFIENRVES